MTVATDAATIEAARAAVDQARAAWASVVAGGFAGFAALVAGGLAYWSGARQVAAARDQIALAQAEAQRARDESGGRIKSERLALLDGISADAARVKMTVERMANRARKITDRGGPREIIPDVLAAGPVFRVQMSAWLRSGVDLTWTPPIMRERWITLLAAVDQLAVRLDVDGPLADLHADELEAALTAIANAADSLIGEIGVLVDRMNLPAAPGRMSATPA